MSDVCSVCPKCGGLLGYFAGTPCSCISGDSTLGLAGKERLTRPEMQINELSTLRSQVKQLQVERNAAQGELSTTCEDRDAREGEVRELQSQVDGLNRNLDMARSEIEETRSLIDSLTKERDQAKSEVASIMTRFRDLVKTNEAHYNDKLEALSSCAVMREALEAIDKSVPAEILERDGCLDKMIWAFTATSGNSLLERLKQSETTIGVLKEREKEARELLTCENMTVDQYITRKAAWLKGGDV